MNRTDKKVSFCVDLGSDTLKIACAYYDATGEIITEKVVSKGFFDIAIPAVAHFSAEDGEWVYGYQLSTKSISSFDTVVKIRDMLSILRRYPDLSAEQVDANVRAYQGSHTFPYFEFPITDSRPHCYDVFCAEDAYRHSRFAAAPATPQKVCESFFAYVYSEVLKPYIADLKHRFATRSLEMGYVLLCPSRVGEAYTDELARLVRKGFGLAESDELNMLTSNKALGMLAVYNNHFNPEWINSSRGESALVFDIGEEQMSVVNFTALKIGGKPTFQVDGVSGHNMPVKLGGNDIDAAIASAFEMELSKRMAIGNVQESGTRNNNYYLMKGIKSAKIVLGKNKAMGSDDYPDGVPIRVCRDTIISHMLTQQQLLHMIGADPGDNSPQKSEVADRIVSYVLAELRRSSNGKVSLIYLSGGVAGTCGLRDYICSRINEYMEDERKRKGRGKAVDISEYTKSFDSVKGCAIPQHELYAYAPSVGGAQMGLKGDKIINVLTRSYGMRTLSTLPDARGRQARVDDSDHFVFLAHKGSPCDEDFHSRGVTFGRNKSSVENLRIYSTSATEEDIVAAMDKGEFLSREWKVRGPDGEQVNCRGLYFPIDNRDYMKKLKNGLDFRLETPQNAKLFLYHGEALPNNRVMVNDDLYLAIGVKIDKEGLVLPDFRIDYEKCKRTGHNFYEVEYEVDHRKASVPVDQLLIAFDKPIVIDTGIGEGA